MPPVLSVPTTPGGETPTSSTLETTTEAADIQQLQRRIHALEAISSKRRRRHHGSSSESDKDLKIKNISQLKYPCTFRQRSEWLKDVKRAFEAAPRQLKKENKQILFALDHLDKEGRAKWDRFLDDKEETGERSGYKNNWKKFEQWTETLLKDAANLEMQLSYEYNRAQQRENQSPIEFHNYLDSLEKQMDFKNDRERANNFLAKLDPDFNNHLRLQIAHPPETREDMVQTAERMWQPWKRLKVKDSRKGRYSEDHETPSKYRRYSNRQEARGGQAERGRKNWARGESETPRKTEEKEVGRSKRQLRIKEQGPEEEKRRCYSCGSTNHLIRDCPKKRDQGKWKTPTVHHTTVTSYQSSDESSPERTKKGSESE